jgi:hypothetical protein
MVFHEKDEHIERDHGNYDDYGNRPALRRGSR